MMLPSLGYFSEVPCVFFLAGSCTRPHCHFRHCARDKTSDDGKLPTPTKSTRDAESEWLGPNLRLSQVTHMVEKAVDKALLANPDKKLDRASMINQALETLRRDSLAKAELQASSSATTTGPFPSYKPTPISILQKRHIPVVAMPVKPIVIRKEKRPDEKPLAGGAPIVSTLQNTSQPSKIDVDPAQNSMAGSKLTENSCGIENTKPLTQQISDFLDSDCSSANDNHEPLFPPCSKDGGSLGHSNADGIGTTERGTFNEVVNIQTRNIDYISEKPDSSPRSASVADTKPDVQLTPVNVGKCIDEQRNQDQDAITQKEEVSPAFEDKTEEIGPNDSLPTKTKNPENRHGSSHKSKRRHSSDSRKRVDSHKKSEKLSHRSSKHKDSKSDHRKHPEKEENGEDDKKQDNPLKEPERESCHQKSLRHTNPSKKHVSHEHSKSHCKKSDEKKTHHKSQEKDNDKHKDKHKEKDHHSHKHNKSENSKKCLSHSEKSKSSSKTSKHSHTKSKSSEKHSSSHSKEEGKGKKRKAEDESVKCIKMAEVKNEGESKEKRLKLEDSDDSTLGSGDQSELVEQSRRSSRESIKRKYSDSDNDVDFVDSPSPGHTAIVISSSSSDERRDDWAASSPELPEASKSDEEDCGAQTTVVALKWSKAKEIIQRSSNSAKPRIAHVPNVMSLLTAKTKILSQEKKPIAKTIAITPSPSSTDQTGENEEGPQPKLMKRIAHGSQGAASRPVVKHIDNTKLPPGIRQHYCNVFYDELCKYLDPEKAKKLAVDEELEVAKRCKIHKIYQNNCSLLLLKIRKMKGNIDRNEQAVEKWTSSSSPEFTYGLTLYQCFEKYLVSGEDLIKNGYPMPLPGQPTCAFIEKTARKYSVQQPDEPFKRRCVNCRKTYEIDQDGLPTTKNDCNYHWGRMRRIGGRSLIVEKYTCCDGADDSLPCQSNAYHVWSGKNEDCIPGFVKTREWPSYRDDSDAGVFALDCEMCYTTRGLELARLTVVDLNEDVVFDEIIALEHPILDYCTRFSGIDENKMKEASMSFQQVQNWVLDHFFDKTILVGHSLENDLNALKVFHKRIVDTSVTFPHKFGPPMKNSLKNLAMSMLALSIQENEKGHDSKEDAVACLKLMMKQIKEDAKVRKPRVIIGYAGKKR